MLRFFLTSLFIISCVGNAEADRRHGHRHHHHHNHYSPYPYYPYYYYPWAAIRPPIIREEVIIKEYPPQVIVPGPTSSCNAFTKCLNKESLTICKNIYPNCARAAGIK